MEFIGVTLVHKTIQVSSVQLNKTSSAQCIMHPLLKVKFLSIPIYPPHSLPSSTSPYPPFPLAITVLLSVCVSYMCVCVCFIYVTCACVHIYMYMCVYTYHKHAYTFTFFYPTLSPLTAFRLFYASVSILFFKLFCSLDSTYK